MLRLTELSTHYGAVKALHSISLEVGKGQIVTLLGANGAGKSTTLLSICGLVRPSSGSVHFEGEQIAGMGVEYIVRRGITQVLEGRELFYALTTFENLTMGAYLRRDKKAIAQDMERVLAYFPVLAQRGRQIAGTPG